MAFSVAANALRHTASDRQGFSYGMNLLRMASTPSCKPVQFKATCQTCLSKTTVYTHICTKMQPSLLVVRTSRAWRQRVSTGEHGRGMGWLPRQACSAWSAWALGPSILLRACWLCPASCLPLVRRTCHLSCWAVSSSGTGAAPTRAGLQLSKHMSLQLRIYLCMVYWVCCKSAACESLGLLCLPWQTCL